MSEEAAVLDTPAVETDLSTTFSDSGADTSSVDTQTGTETEQFDDHDEPQADETDHLRGKELFRSVKDKLKNGEKLTPREFRSLRNAINIAGRADEAAGGDYTRLEADRVAYEQLRGPGEESYTPEQLVEQVRTDRQQLAGIFDDLKSGAPKLIDEIVTDYPDSFPNLAIQAMNKFAEVNNEAFSTYVAKSAYSYLSSKQVPQQFALLGRFLPESSTDPATQIVIDCMNVLKDALGGLGTMANKPIDIKKPEAKPVTQQQGTENAEHKLRRYEWDSKASPVNRTLRDTEIKAIEASRKLQLTPEERQRADAAIKEEFDTRISLIRDVLKGYVEASNERGYVDRVTSEGKKMLPGIVKRHINEILDGRRTAPAKQTTKMANGQQSTEGRKDATGSVWISGSPASIGLAVDLNRTTHSMLARNEAYIKGRPGLHKWKARTA